MILPRIVDKVLSEVLIFKLFRTESATGAVTLPAIIVILNIIKYCRSHYFPAGKALSVDSFHFQRGKEAFRAGIVIIAAFHTHAPAQIMAFQQPLIVRRTVLRASVRMHDDISRALSPPYRHL